MMNKTKKSLFLFLLLLPLGAFADFTNPLAYLKPPSTDYSLSLLNRIFGSVGTTLSGSGNQLIGTLIGVFNGFWVVMLSLAIFYVAYMSVISFSQSGEAMGGQHGKKAVFAILRIVIGFALVAPSASTGYSLAQNGVIWTVVQGIGLADKISGKLYNYLSDGGMSFQTKPTTGNDVIPLMGPVGDIIKAQVCMFGMEQSLNHEKKKQDDAWLEANPGSTAPISEGQAAPAGYSINRDNSITMGSYNDKYNPDDESSHRYNNECGQITWSVDEQKIIARMTTSDGKVVGGDVASQKATALAYMQQGVTEMFFNVITTSKALAEVDPNADNVNTTYQAIADRAAPMMAAAGMSYATILDPLRQKELLARDKKAGETLQNLNAQGWIYTPLMVILPGITQTDSGSVANDFPPYMTPPNVANMNDGVWKQVSNTNDIITLIGRVDRDNYVAKANGILASMSANQSWADIEFDAILTEFTQGNNDLERVSDYVELAMESIKKPLEGTKYLSDLAHDIAIAPIAAMNSVIKGIEGVIDSVRKGLNKVGKEVYLGNVGDKMGLKNINLGSVDVSGTLAYLEGSKNTARNAIQDQINSVTDVVAEVNAGLHYSRKGGMNDALASLTGKAGPMGPVFTAIMTNMVGHGMGQLEENLFSGKYNAFNGSIRMGGQMMVSAMQASFQYARIVMVTKSAEAIMKLASSVGGAGTAFVSTIVGMVGGAVSTLVGFYVTFALVFFLGGIMLYILLPLTFVIGFAASAFRWMGMTFVNVLAAPIFCFNLIRSDAEGLIGRGERYLADLFRTAITPAVLTLGAVAFVLLFNIAFLLITATLGQFIPILLQSFSNDILMAVVMGVMLLIFAMVLLWIAQMLTALCTAELVQAVEHAIGEGIQRMEAHSPYQEMKQGVTSGGQHISGTVEKVTSKPGSGG